MKAYKIRNWDKHYENNRSRDLKRPEWLPLPNKFDGSGFMELMDHPAGMSHYGAWCLLLGAASRMPVRGLMVSDSGRPLTVKDIARMTRGSFKGFEEALPRLIEIGWIEEVDTETLDISEDNADNAASGEDAEGHDDAVKSQLGAGISQPGAEKSPLKGKGNRKGNVREGRGVPPYTAGGIVEINPDDDEGTPPTVRPSSMPAPPPISLMDWKAHGHGKLTITATNRDEWQAMWRRWKDIEGWTDAWEIAYKRLADVPKIWPDKFAVILDELAKRIVE